jgi:GntR family transcriptional repressor for pyruvate dehydrogenase complex
METADPSPPRGLGARSGTAADDGLRLVPGADPEEKLASRLARYIARDVAERGLTPGSLLAPEQAMAEQYAVGRASIREALRLLETQGLVVLRRGVGGGPVVGAPAPSHLGRTVTLHLQMSATTFGDALDSQTSLEGSVAALAATRYARARPAVKRQIAAFVNTVETSDSPDNFWLDTSVDFHRLIWTLAGNSTLKLLAGAVGAIVSDRVHLDPHAPWTLRERRRNHTEHVAIATAIAEEDVIGAREAMERHVRRTNKAIRRHYPGLADQLIDWH